MSIEAVSWALNFADVRDPGEALVLIGIANHAGKDGRGCWAGQATLAHYARCSERTLRRKLSALEARGVIVRGDQALVDHIPASRRPVVWDLEWPGQNGRPVSLSGQVGQGWPDNGGTVAGHMEPSGRSRMAGKPEDKPLGEPSELKDFPPVPDFSDFWTVYPRHAARPDAVKAWAKAVKRADPQTIIAGAARYAADPNRDPGFTAHPATWLNRDGWEDEPVPAARGRQADRGAGILQAEYLAAQAADAAAVSGYIPGQLAIDGGPR